MDFNEAAEMVHQYCPPQGLVLGLFAGTMVIAMAALRLNRNSINIEVDQACLDAAMGRMKKYYKYLKLQALIISRRPGAGFSSVGPGPVERSRGFERGLRDRQFA